MLSNGGLSCTGAARFWGFPGQWRVVKGSSHILKKDFRDLPSFTSVSGSLIWFCWGRSSLNLWSRFSFTERGPGSTSKNDDLGVLNQGPKKSEVQMFFSNVDQSLGHGTKRGTGGTGYKKVPNPLSAVSNVRWCQTLYQVKVRVLVQTAASRYQVQRSTRQQLTSLVYPKSLFLTRRIP